MTFFQIQSELGSGWQPQGQEHGWSCGGGQASSGGGGWWPSRPFSPFVTAPPPLHCHTQVMVAAVNGDVIIHPLLKLDISAAQICVSLRLSELDSSAFVSLASACSKPAFN